MPEITTLTVDPMQVKKGDLLDDATSADLVTGKTVYQNGHMITEVKVGPTNTTLETTGGRVMIKNTGSAIIRREVETAADKEAKKQAMLAELRVDLTRKVNRWVTAATKDRAEAVERMAGSQLSDHWDMDKFLAANSRVKIAGTIENIMNRARDQKLHVHEGECNHERTDEGYRCTIEGRPTTEWDGVQTVFKALTRQLLETASGRRVLSRSTSLTANLMEDLEAEALADFFKDFRYELARDLHLVSPFTAGLDF
jgi:hypothetical protein